MSQTEPLPESPHYFGDDPYRTWRLFGPLGPSTRKRVDLTRRRVVATLRDLDAEAVDLIRRRRDALDEALEVHETLWPRLAWPHPRRPPRPDRPPLPAVPVGARWVSGCELRRTCLALLRIHGTLTLFELHTALHLAGCAICSRHPTKALAEARAIDFRV